ncbi:hypothetical protein [Orenia marismortui]|uniref:Uncharacterized protein n=1 Tax=Orenia marismortui TaxID=46469 RepID=A0A4R8GE00_9FIRM|nr:hypothetical protein [Orenia marismortui]TDX43692.1 hypothetical protein C7959_1601 [Orenia marismortui]
MNKNLLTINRYVDLDNSNSLHLIEEIRSFIRKAKEINPKLKSYHLYDVGFIPKSDLILVKLYFWN